MINYNKKQKTQLTSNPTQTTVYLNNKQLLEHKEKKNHFSNWKWAGMPSINHTTLNKKSHNFTNYKKL